MKNKRKVKGFFTIDLLDKSKFLRKKLLYLHLNNLLI